MAECKIRTDVVSFLLCSVSFFILLQYTLAIYVGGFNYLNTNLTANLPPTRYLPEEPEFLRCDGRCVRFRSCTEGVA